MKIISSIPFQPTTLADICGVLCREYNTILPVCKEWRDMTGMLRVTLRTYTNDTSHFQVRNIHGEGGGLSCRKVPA